MSDSDESYQYSDGDDDYDEDGGGGESPVSGSDSGADDMAEDVETKIDNAFYTAHDDERPDGNTAKLQGDLDRMAQWYTKALANYDLAVELEDSREDHTTDYTNYFQALQYGTGLKYELLAANPSTSDFSEVEARYDRMLESVSKVSSNTAADGINYVLDLVSACPDTNTVKRIYAISLRNLIGLKKLSLLFSLRVRMAKLHVEQLRKRHVERRGQGGAGGASESKEARESDAELASLLAEIHSYCMTKSADGEPSGHDDPAKASQLMEVYALKLQVCDINGDTAGTKDIWERCTSKSFAGAAREGEGKSLIESSVANPTVMGTVLECFGKWFMRIEEYDQAYNTFINSFEEYNKAGRAADAQRALSYELTADMLSSSKHADPMQTKEAKAYLGVPLIEAMHNLQKAYQEKRVHDFERYLRESPMVTEEPFIAHYLAELIFHTRVEALHTLIQPYSSVRLDFLAKQLNMEMKAVEDLVVKLVLDGQLVGSIDQLTGSLQLANEGGKSHKSRKYAAISRWTERVEQLRNGLERRLS